MPIISGYSGTPLAKKLGIKTGCDARLVGAPSYYHTLFDDMPDAVNFNDDANCLQDFIHFFVQDEAAFLEILPKLKAQLKQNGMIWVSWPKKASKLPTNITEDIIRNFAIAIGLVDIKVCAVDEIWSGLKLVIPVKDRK